MVKQSTTIGQYRILELIGQGGMATVYKAYHARLDRLVAIKMIHKQHLEDIGFTARFEREAQIVARLEHPHIVPVYDYDEYDGQPYLVMKYIEGKTLKDILRKRRLTHGECLVILEGIASALDYAHEKGILHRDIKPSNILLDARATPYLTDFGLARVVHGGTSTISVDMLIGTPYYMSPEQARGDDDIDHRADLYSLGIVAYEMLTGRVPFNAATPYSIIHMQVNAELPRPRSINPDLPPAAEAVLMKALAKDRNQRFDKAGELVAALRDAFSGESDSAVPQPSQPPTQVFINGVQRRAMTAPPDILSSAAQAGRQDIVSSRPQRKRSVAVKRRGWLPWAIGILLVSGALLTLSALANRQRPVDEPDVPTLASLPTSAQPAAEPTPNDLALYEVPELDIEAAERLVAAEPENSLAYLARFRSDLAAGQTEALSQILAAGLVHSENRAIFLLTAASLASAQAEDDIALRILLDGLTRLQDDPSYPIFREHGGFALYQAALSPRGVELFQVRGARAVSPSALRSRTPIELALAARALLSFDRGSGLASMLVDAALRRSPDLPEAVLIRGEISAHRGSMLEAQRLWEQVREMEDAPDWVRRRAAALLGETSS